MRLHEGQLRESSRSFSFCLQNLSIAFPKKKTGGDKGALLLVVREGAVAPLFAHVSVVVLAIFFWERALPAQKRENCKGLIYSFISLGKTLRDWSRQGDTYVIT